MSWIFFLIYHHTISKLVLGGMCLACSTLNFLRLYETAPGLVRPAALVTCLPQINSQFQQGQQQCAAEFFQEFCHVLGHTANLQYQTENLIPVGCSLSSKFSMPSREDSNVVHVVDCNLGICTCQQGVNGNACPHQAAVALKFGINNVNFIPQTAKERFNLATLAVGSNQSFSVAQFVSLHQKEIENNTNFSGDYEMEEKYYL